MSLSAKDIIRISTSVVPAGMFRTEVGRTMFFTSAQNDKFRVREYSSIEEVANDFASGTEPYEASKVYFSQSPYPKNLLIGIRKYVEQAPYSVTGEYSKREDYLADGQTTKIDVTFSNGETAWIHGYGLDGKLNLAEFSSADDALEAINEFYKADSFDYSGSEELLPNVVVTYSKKCRCFTFSVTAITNDPTIKVTDVALTDSSATGFEHHIKIRTDTDDVQTVEGEYPYWEGAEEALSAIAEENPAFTFVCEDKTFTDTDQIGTIADWCKSQQNYILCCASHDEGVLSGDETTEFAKLLSDMNDNAMGTWSIYEDYKHVSIAGRLSSVNFSAHNSLITANMKTLPSCSPDSLTTDIASTLKEGRINFYSTRSGIPMYEEGYTFSPDYWVDTKYWLIWFEDALRVALFNVLYRSKKIPQTNDGIALLQTVAEKVCMQGVANGGIASGVLSDAITNEIRQITGNKTFNGHLQKGYLVYIEPVSEQSPSDRDQRKAPPIHIWLKGSGAIHSVDVSVLFEQ